MIICYKASPLHKAKPVKGEGLTGGQEGFKSSLKTSHTREPLEEQKSSTGSQIILSLAGNTETLCYLTESCSTRTEKKKKKSQQQHLLVAAW